MVSAQYFLSQQNTVLTLALRVLINASSTPTSPNSAMGVKGVNNSGQSATKDINNRKKRLKN
jgi:hypothetical protein